MISFADQVGLPDSCRELVIELFDGFDDESSTHSRDVYGATRVKGGSCTSFMRSRKPARLVERGVAHANPRTDPLKEIAVFVTVIPYGPHAAMIRSNTWYSPRIFSGLPRRWSGEPPSRPGIASR
jgi:hypothetical protein